MKPQPQASTQEVLAGLVVPWAGDLGTVEVHAYADRIVIRQDGPIVGEHRRRQADGGEPPVQ